MTDRHWRDRANCIDVDDELFFVGKSEALSPDNRRALTFCAGCEVKAECLAEELAMDPHIRRHHIRGGITPRGIGRILTAQKKETA